MFYTLYTICFSVFTCFCVAPLFVVVPSDVTSTVAPTSICLTRTSSAAEVVFFERPGRLFFLFVVEVIYITEKNRNR